MQWKPQKNYNKSFQEIILTKQNSSLFEPTTKKPRRNIDLKARIVTSKQFLNAVKEKKAKKKTKKIDFTTDDNDKGYDDDDDDDDDNIFEYEHEIPKRKADEIVESSAEK